MSIGNPFIGTGVPPVPASGPSPSNSPPKAGPTAKINGTQTFASYLTPNDGKVHRISIVVLRNVTSLETGGATGWSGVLGGQALTNIADLSGNASAGLTVSRVEVAADPNTLVTYQQINALTGGASTIQVWFFDLGPSTT